MRLTGFSEEMGDAARRLGLPCALLQDGRAAQIRHLVHDAFGGASRGEPLWDEGVFRARFQDPDAWRLLSEFISDSCVVFFDPRLDARMVRLEKGTALVLVLGETSGFEFYVTDDQASYLLCFNHHDTLLAAGRAVPWLLARPGATPTGFEPHRER